MKVHILIVASTRKRLFTTELIRFFTTFAEIIALRISSDSTVKTNSLEIIQLLMEIGKSIAADEIQTYLRKMKRIMKEPYVQMMKENKHMSRKVRDDVATTKIQI